MNIKCTNSTTNVPTCLTTKDIQIIMQDGTHLQDLMIYRIEGWPSNRNIVKQDIGPFWTLEDELSMIGEIAMKGNRVIIWWHYIERYYDNYTATIWV